MNPPRLRHLQPVGSIAYKLFRWLLATLLWLVVVACLAITLVPPFLDRIYYRGPASGHYDGAHFFNPDGDDTAAPPTGGSRGGFLTRMALGNDGRPPWPDGVAIAPAKPAARVTGEAMTVTWVGHATMLIQTRGLNILTDPIWSDVAGPFGLVGPRRVAPPGIRFDDLPKIDVVLVSHNHYDHMDVATLKRLWERDRPRILTSLGNDTVINGGGAQSEALDWGQRVAIAPDVAIVATRNHHWGSRWGSDRNRALWSSFTITLPGGNIFFAGDTGPGDMRWPAEAARLGPVRLAILPIGAFRFRPGQMVTGSHIGPREAVQVFEGLGASFGFPMHWGTFRLSFEGYDTPPRMLDLFARCAGLAPDAFRPRRIGVPVFVPPYSAPVRGAPTGGRECREGSAELRALK